MFAARLRFALVLVLVFVCPGLAAAADLVVHTSDDKELISKVATDIPYIVLQKQQNWEIVRFSSPAVPIWVSENYVRLEDGVAVVSGDRLRMRIRPAPHAAVVGLISRGHKSAVLGRRDGYVRIYAPRSVAFALSRGAPAAAVNDGPVAVNAQAMTAAQDSANSMESDASQLTPSVSQPATDTGSEAGSAPTTVGTAEVNVPPAQIFKPALVESPVVQNQAKTIAQQHRLAPGDTISLQVFGEQDLSISSVRIPQSGRVSFPLIGSTEVAGKSIKEVESEVRESLSQGYIRNPRLSVTIDSYRPIFIKGAIANTGSFPYTEGLTISKVIALAGGTKNSARETGVSISRDGVVLERDLSIDSEYEVLSGDIISVEEEIGVGEESTLYVYLHGEVARAGEYRFRRGLTVEKAVVLAGGFTLRASRRKISVSRMIEGEEAPVKLKKVALYFPVEPGDIIDIGASWF